MQDREIEIVKKLRMECVGWKSKSVQVINLPFLFRGRGMAKISIINPLCQHYHFITVNSIYPNDFLYHFTQPQPCYPEWNSRTSIPPLVLLFVSEPDLLSNICVTFSIFPSAL